MIQSTTATPLPTRSVYRRRLAEVVRAALADGWFGLIEIWTDSAHRLLGHRRPFGTVW
ncbi:hypothetical protein I553_2140 [Mycobacterium xenopi 4042]|uniref:Uncharacterized protein n=1 Tax=Mycobacterium xenopi 4042 TaxID=1299334 RepID=X8DJY3_MYCXE|nr:hypothetical protein I552_7099 [Mycobacterium xenopi 3993]EUA68952.1 hypothetical protein I553_2140 [Mycobacterium xenopi 4042]